MFRYKLEWMRKPTFPAGWTSWFISGACFETELLIPVSFLFVCAVVPAHHNHHICWCFELQKSKVAKLQVADIREGSVSVDQVIHARQVPATWMWQNSVCFLVSPCRPSLAFWLIIAITLNTHIKHPHHLMDNIYPIPAWRYLEPLSKGNIQRIPPPAQRSKAKGREEGRLPFSASSSVKIPAQSGS